MRAEDRALLEDVAACLEYPGVGFEEKKIAARRHRGLDETPARRALGRTLSGLALHMTEVGKSCSEETYTRLFDLSPVCTLHLGYQLFGDSYERGELLARLVPEVRRAGVELRGELPDFLPVLLRLLARVGEEEDSDALVTYLFLPALEKMTAALGDSCDPWSLLVRALPDLLHELFLAQRKEVLAHA